MTPTDQSQEPDFIVPPTRRQIDTTLDLLGIDLAHAGPLVPTGPEATLTAGEQAVARLAAQRLTNPEIADKLTVSRNTVEYHLSHVYTKLGITRRTQVARPSSRLRASARSKRQRLRPLGALIGDSGMVVRAVHARGVPDGSMLSASGF